MEETMTKRYAIFTKQRPHESERMEAFFSRLEESGCDLYGLNGAEDLRPDTDAVISVGGDGTFLSAAAMAAPLGLPVLGVNTGRLGFLSEYSPEELVEPLLAGEYEIEHRAMLCADPLGTTPLPGSEWAALNEVAVHRYGTSILEIDITVDGINLPTYWADGLLVATSSGSTAYSLSAGGPICTPDTKVLVITPIAPHNLNVRPLVVPESSRVEISVRTRDSEIMVTMDNRNVLMPSPNGVVVSVAHFSLKRIRLNRSNFFTALRTKLFWGEDARNN